MGALPAALSFFNNDLQGTPYVDSGSVSFYSSLGDNYSGMFGSLATSWSEAYTSCSSSYSPAAAFFPGASSLPDEPQLVYPTEEDILLGVDTSEFLQQLHGCSNQPVMHPKLVHTLKNMVTPPGSPHTPYFDHQQLNGHHHDDQHGFIQGSEVGFKQERVLLEQQAQMSLSDDSVLTSCQEVTVAVESDLVEKHEPPPLDMKRLEKVEEPCDDDIEAAEVSVDLIQNRRPFRCGQEGCNKTFKNPQTMKMHHKTHYTDGSAMGRDGLATLPTLTSSSLKAGQNKKIPSRCPKCRKTFVGLYELRRHYGRKHSEGEKPFGCRKCGKKFFIEVDVRDHEKLCGEPIECKCGLKFAFKCNLVAHKKAHPACQEQNNHNTATNCNYNSSNNQSTTTTTTSDEDSSQSQSRGRASPPLPRQCTKRSRPYEQAAASSTTTSSSTTSRHTMSYTPPAPNFKGLPEAKAARYDFAGLQFSTEGSSLWGSNMHYPSVDFANLPVPSPATLPATAGVSSTMYSSILAGFQPEHQFHSRKPESFHHELKFLSDTVQQSTSSRLSALHGAMIRLN